MLEELTAGSNYTPSSSLSNMLELTAWKLFHTQKNPSVCRVIWSQLLNKNNHLLSTVIFSNSSPQMAKICASEAASSSPVVFVLQVV